MMKEKMSRIVRFSFPSELDHAPQFATCFCSDQSVWVQMAKDEEIPKWLRFESEEEAEAFLCDFKNNG